MKWVSKFTLECYGHKQDSIGVGHRPLPRLVRQVYELTITQQL